MDNNNWTIIDSSMLDAVAAHGEDLYVRFNNGQVYKYKGAAGHFEGVKAAASAGKYLNAHVKGKYEYVKIEKPTQMDKGEVQAMEAESTGVGMRPFKGK